MSDPLDNKIMDLISNSNDLLTAALASITGNSVVTYDTFQNSHSNNDAIYENLVYSQLTNKGPVHVDEPPPRDSDDSYDDSYSDTPHTTFLYTPSTTCYPRSDPRVIAILIKTLTGDDFEVLCDTTETLLEVKVKISKINDVRPERQKLFQNGKELLDNGKRLLELNIADGDTLKFMAQSSLGQDGIVDLDALSLVYLPEKLRAKEFDYDYRSVNDLGVKYYRGRHTYKRPIGWVRIGLNVMGKFGNNDIWVGEGPIGRINSRASANDEWPVSYHGTGRHHARTIAGEGYRLSKGVRFEFGRGIYTTPDIDIAEKFATEFTHEGSTYKVVLQNRVNHKTLKRVYIKQIKGEYWVNEKEQDVRPYGICIKEVK